MKRIAKGNQAPALANWLGANAALHKRSDRPIESLSKVKQLIAKWTKKNQTTLQCEEFCVPLVQVAKAYAQFLRTRGYSE